VIHKILGYTQKPPAHVYLRPLRRQAFSRRVTIKVSSIKFYANPSCGSRIYTCRQTHGRMYGRARRSQTALSTTKRTRLKGTSLHTRCPARQWCRTLTALGLSTLCFGNSLTTNTELKCNRIYKIYYVFFSLYRWGQHITLNAPT